MAFDNLTQKLEEAFKSLKGKGKIDEDDLKQALRQVRLALNYWAAFRAVSRLRPNHRQLLCSLVCKGPVKQQLPVN